MFASIPEQKRVNSLDWFDDDETLLAKTEADLLVLIRHWKRWLLCECSEPQPYMRFDFFIKRIEKMVPGSDKPEVYIEIFTGELTELGGSTLNWKEGPSTVFRAVLGSCLEGDEVPPAGVFMRKYEGTHIRFDDSEDEQE